MRRLMLLLLLLLLGAAQTVTATDARAAETRGPSMTVGLVLASCTYDNGLESRGWVHTMHALEARFSDATLT